MHEHAPVVPHIAAEEAARCDPKATLLPWPGPMTETSIAGGSADRPRDEGELNHLLLAAGRAVDLGRRLLVHGRSHIGALIAKGDRDYATRVDLQIETQVKAALADAAAEIPFLGEETGGSLEPARMWVLDPIDGTTNFIKGSPLCAISLALLEGGQPVFGIVDLPLLDERYVARAGAGAYLNGMRLHTVDITRLDNAAIAITDFAVVTKPTRTTRPR
jgi:myo-inositol-1(or 4)-monophosphatase